MRIGRECALVMTSQHIQSHAGDQIDFGVKADLLFASAQILICDYAVEGVFVVLERGRGRVDCDVDFEVEGEREADDVEAWADVGGGAGDADAEGGGHFICV